MQPSSFRSPKYSPKAYQDSSVKTQLLSNQSKPKAQSPPRYMSPRQTRSPKVQNIQPTSQTTTATKKRTYREDKENINQSSLIDRLAKPKHSPQQNFNSPPQEPSKPNIRPQSPVSSTYRTQKLYEDAFKTKQPKEYYFKPPTKDNTKSKKFQVDHFIKEFYKQITSARQWTLENIDEHRRKSSFDYDVEGDLCLMTLDELVYVLNGLGFMPISSYDPIDPENKAIKLFRSLQCPQGLGIILTRNLLVGRYKMLVYKDQIVQIPNYLNSYCIEFPKHFQSGLFEFEDGNLIISDMKQIQKQYAYLYNSYLSYYKKPIVQQQPQECAPTERCNHKTQQLANTFRQRFKSFVSSKSKLNLNDFQEIYRQKKIMKQESEIQKQLSECTFRPQINAKHNTQHNSFNQLSQPKHKQEKSTNLIQYELQKEQCTFTPDISRSQSSHNFSIQPIGSSVKDSKVVQRLVQGRVGKKAKELALQMGYSLNKTKRVALEHIAIHEEISRYTRSRHISSISSSSQVPPQSQQPCPSPLPSPSPTIQPNLFIDVNLEDNQVDRIVVYDHSDAKDLAVQFAQKHNLDENTIKRLTKIIEEQIATTK